MDMTFTALTSASGLFGLCYDIATGSSSSKPGVLLLENTKVGAIPDEIKIFLHRRYEGAFNIELFISDFGRSHDELLEALFEKTFKITLKSGGVIRNYSEVSKNETEAVLDNVKLHFEQDYKGELESIFGEVEDSYQDKLNEIRLQHYSKKFPKIYFTMADSPHPFRVSNRVYTYETWAEREAKARANNFT